MPLHRPWTGRRQFCDGIGVVDAERAGVGVAHAVVERQRDGVGDLDRVVAAADWRHDVVDGVPDVVAVVVGDGERQRVANADGIGVSDGFDVRNATVTPMTSGSTTSQRVDDVEPVVVSLKPTPSVSTTQSCGSHLRVRPRAQNSGFLAMDLSSRAV